MEGPDAKPEVESGDGDTSWVRCPPGSYISEEEHEARSRLLREYLNELRRDPDFKVRACHHCHDPCRSRPTHTGSALRWPLALCALATGDQP